MRWCTSSWASTCVTTEQSCDGQRDYPSDKSGDANETTRIHRSAWQCHCLAFASELIGIASGTPESGVKGHFEDHPAAKLLTREEARHFAAKVATLPARIVAARLRSSHLPLSVDVNNAPPDGINRR
jgi:hypothetical protein